MRRFPPALALLATLAACGDDGKTAPRGTPAAPPIAPPAESPTGPASVPPPASSPPATGSSVGSSWDRTRAGDWATWEIRVTGSDSVTRVTWRATRVDSVGVRYSVEARTLDVAGSTRSLVTSDELHARGESGAPSIGTQESMTVGSRKLLVERLERSGATGKSTLWVSPVLPFSGLVRSESTDAVQTLIAFGP